MRRDAKILLGALGACALLVAAKSIFTGLNAYFLYYTLPIAVPFAAFLIERLADRGAISAALVDASVIVLSISRAFYPVPFVSGHVLFTAYAFATANSRAVRWSAALVLAEVMVLKLALWGDFGTPAGALSIAVIGWRVHTRLVGRVSRGAETLDGDATGGPDGSSTPLPLAGETVTTSRGGGNDLRRERES
ncbi:MAG: hypothetical protein IT378_21535 [Sandaracinaceae bacterium]|nr:hypothetical protein [Sandaracinaceae bacterium]